MKKFLIAMAALMMLAFVGCGKEEETAADALTGTTWESSYEGIPLSVSFSVGGIVTLNMGSETYTGTYTYKAPDVTIQMPIDGRNVTFAGTCSNGVLNISSSEYGSFVFTRTGGPSHDESDESDDSVQGPAEGVKLIKQVVRTEGDYKYIYKCEYDDRNRISKAFIEEAGYGTVSCSFSYKENEVDINVANITLRLPLNEYGYATSITNGVAGQTDYFSYDNDGCLTTENSSALGKFHYEWNDGNIVSMKGEEYDLDLALTYYETTTLTPSNINLAALLGLIIFTEDYDSWYQLAAFSDVFGKHCKSPVKTVVNKDSRNEYTENYSYEYYDDGSISKITVEYISYDYSGTTTFEFTYF